MKTLNQLAQEAIQVSEDKKVQFKHLKDEVYRLTGEYYEAELLIKRLNLARESLKPTYDKEAFLA